jgi:hypothetical protein
MHYIVLNKDYNGGDDDDDDDDNNNNNKRTSESEKIVEETSWLLDRYVSLMDKMTAT